MTTLLEVREVSRSFGDVRALDDVSLTLPITVYAMVRTGVTPEINALATVLVVISVLVVVVAARAIRPKEKS